MTEKVEAAKIASELTIALINDRHGQLRDLVFKIRDEDTRHLPDVVLAFDYFFKHVQTLLTEQ